MRKTKIVSFLMIMLALAFSSSLFMPQVRAVGVAITNVSPASHSGKVGDAVHIAGTINSTGGSYRVFYKSQMVASGNATGNSVNATFTVPQLPKGNNTLILQDVSKNINATSWFAIVTAYYVSVNKTPVPAPKQWQEGDSVAIWMNVTGGDADRIYSANVTVKTPTPTNETYWAIAKFNTTATGYGASRVTYPNASLFSGRPHTNYTGTYDIAFNKTQATNSFFIGLTNSSQYHRSQFVDIKAVGYKPNENVTAKITLGGNVTYLENKTADLTGTVRANWTIPITSYVGSYTVNVTSRSPSPTRKTRPDIQAFKVPGFSVNVTTQNLAGEPVPRVTLNVTERGKTAAVVTGDSSGVVPLMLEIGNYTCRATFKYETVGRLSLNITGPTVLSLICNLTNLRLSVVAIKDGAAVGVPEVTLFMTPENRQLYTDIDGMAVAHSLLPNRTYTLNAYRYNVQFNVTEIPSLLVGGNPQAWFNATMTVPVLTMKINATNAEGQPLNGITIKAREHMGGLSYQGTTDVNGTVSLNCALGKYSVTAYDTDGIELNRTATDLLNLILPVKSVPLSCSLYGLSISVKIVDYFSQPLQNVNITLQREGLPSRSALTQANGTATFYGVTGGDMQATIYLPGQTQAYAVNDFTALESMVVVVKVERYAMLAGSFVEVGQLATALVVLVTVLAILSLEVYRRRRAKAQKTGN